MLRIAIVILAFVYSLAFCETYYVDFDSGSDKAKGTSADTAFKHCPGDPNADMAASLTQLQSGDTVIFKGGVNYTGCIAAAKTSGTSPVIYDGNTSGNFGEGRAVINGSVPLTGWKKCKSADDAAGNPNWQKLWYNHVDGDCNIYSLNLCQNGKHLNVAQHPNQIDPFFFDQLDNWHPIADPLIQTVSAVKISAGENTSVNGSRPLVLLADGSAKSSAVINELASCEINFELPQVENIESVAITNTSNYTAISEFEILADGKPIYTGTLEKNGDSQKFTLETPVKLKKLTFRAKAIHPSKNAWGAIAEIAAFNSTGKNVLLAEAHSSYTDAEFLNQSDAYHWSGATAVIFAKPAQLYYRRIKSFDPATHTIYFDLFIGDQYRAGQGKITIFNAPATIDTPGEYAILPKSESDSRRKIILYPQKSSADDIEGVSYSPARNSRQNSGFDVSGGKNITIQGFEIRQFAGSGCSGVKGSNCSGLLLRDNKIHLLGAQGRSAAVDIYGSDKVIVQNCDIRFNRRCSAIILNKCSNSIVQGCLMDSNGSTALDYYGCTDSKILDNTVARHKGVHANGLTMYLGCKNILVQNNRVFDGNACLTAQEGENITIQNNIFDAFGNAQTIGLWRGKPLENVYIYNNLILRGMHNDWAAALYSDNPIKGDFIIRNNVIDGWAINRATPTHSHNIFTHLGPAGKEVTLGETEIFCSDLDRLFANMQLMDYRPKPDSPAVDAGIEIKGRIADMLNSPASAGDAPDIGPIEYREKPWREQ